MTEKSPEIDPDLHRKVQDAATILFSAREAWTRATAHAAAVAQEAAEAGMNEVALAKLLGVDRSRTLRRWLGKKKTK